MKLNYWMPTIMLSGIALTCLASYLLKYHKKNTMRGEFWDKNIELVAFFLTIICILITIVTGGNKYG